MTDDVESRQLCTFLVDGVLFGVDVTEVQEVIRHQEMTPVPLAPRVVSGLINLRGQIVTALDLRHRLQIRPREGDEQPMNVVIKASEGVVSLLVDEIGDVIEVDSAAFEPVPENLEGVARDILDGIYKTSDQLLLVLNTAKVSAITNA